MQQHFYTTATRAKASLDRATEYINAAIEVFRKADLPIVAIQHKNAEWGLVPGEEAFEMPEALNIEPTDLHIHKTYSNAFNKTSLADELRELGVDTVLITGYCAGYCTLSSYHGAQDHDFTPLMLRGGLASTMPENIPFVERVTDVVSYGALAKILESSAKAD